MSRNEKREVAEIILRFLEDRSSDPWEWGEYLSIKERDPNLEQIRLFCASIRDYYPPLNPSDYCNDEGLGELRRIARSLMEK